MSAAEAVRSDPGLPIDTVLEILSDARRRRLLYTVYESAEGAVPVDRIVDEVFALERSSTEGDLPPEYRDSVDNMVRHEALPALTGLRVVEWEQASNLVSYVGRYPLDEWLERIRIAEDPPGESVGT